MRDSVRKAFLLAPLAIAIAYGGGRMPQPTIARAMRLRDPIEVLRGESMNFSQCLKCSLIVLLKS